MPQAEEENVRLVCERKTLLGAPGPRLVLHYPPPDCMACLFLFWNPWSGEVLGSCSGITLPLTFTLPSCFSLSSAIDWLGDLRQVSNWSVSHFFSSENGDNCDALFMELGLRRWHSSKESAGQCRRHKRRRFDPWVGKIPWSRKRQLAPVFLPRKFHAQRSLVSYSPWGRKKSDWTHTHIHGVRALVFISFDLWPTVGNTFYIVIQYTHSYTHTHTHTYV